MNELAFKKAVEDSPVVKCQKGVILFEKRTLFKKLSALVSPTGSEMMIPIDVEICPTCGKIPRDLYKNNKAVPEELLSDCGTEPDEPKSSLILS